MKSAERKFIHDISSPIGVAFGMIETVLELTTENKPLSADDLRRLQKALNSLTKVTDLIHARRAEIKSEEESSGQGTT